MSKRTDEPTRMLGLMLTIGGQRRHVSAKLAAGDRLEFTAAEQAWSVSLPLVDLFWQALRSDPNAKREGLLPRVLSGEASPREKHVTDGTLARRYGVTRGRVSEWRREGHDVRNPDAVGDLIFHAKDKGRKRRE